MVAGNSVNPDEVGSASSILQLEKDFSAVASAPLQLIVLKSFDQAERSIRQIDHLVLIAGLFAMLLGTVLMMALSSAVTRPLEELASGVRAFGVGDSSHLLPHRGTREVRRAEYVIRSACVARSSMPTALCSNLNVWQRLAVWRARYLMTFATILQPSMQMRSSSLLRSFRRPNEVEIFADIRMAVHGTTELLESLLIFSRTGTAIRRSNVLMSTLLERAMVMVHTHPDATAVTLVASYDDPAETAAVVDEKQIERAIYNLLLNACQSVRASTDVAQVVCHTTRTEWKD